jgi:hypothetical protein
MADDVVQLHLLPTAGRDRLHSAMDQLGETLTAIDLARFLELSLPALPLPDQAILGTDAAAHLFAGLREGLTTGAEGAVETSWPWSPPGGDRGVRAGVSNREGVGAAIDHPDRHRGLAGGGLGEATQIRLGLQARRCSRAPWASMAGLMRA